MSNPKIKDYILIIGAMKSGTSTLFNILGQHPEIAPCHNKEPGFFAFPEIWEKGFEWYESLWDFEPGVHRHALEATTDYTKFPFCRDVPDRIRSSVPRRFKLIYIMRHPLRRIESHARHLDRSRKEIGQALSGQAVCGLDDGISEVSMASTYYARQIDQYEAEFKKGDLFLTTLEELKADPLSVIEEILKFLDLNPDPGVNVFLSSNSAKDVRVAHSLWIKLSDIRWLNTYIKWIFPDNFRHWLWKSTRTEMVGSARYEMMPEEESRVLAQLGADLARLQDIYNVDVKGIWGIDLDRADCGPVR